MRSAPTFTPQFDRHIPEFYRIFTLLDKQKKGYLDVDDFKKVLQNLNQPSSLEEVNEMINFIHHSNNNKSEKQSIDFPTFIAWIYRTLHTALDTDQNGRVSPEEVTTLAQQLGLPLELPEALHLMGGEVDFATFTNLLTIVLSDQM